MQVVVRLAGGDVSVDGPVSATQLLAAIRAARPDLSNRQLRFFINGRPLDPESDFAGRDTVYIHCFAGRILTAQELEREALGVEQPAAPAAAPAATPAREEVRGFDRLRSMGFSEEDVASMRLQFADTYGSSADADPLEQQQLEDLWIDNGDMSPYASRVNDLMCIFVGVFGGCWSLLLLKLYGFTRRQYATILFGVLINLVFSVFQCLT